MLRYLVYSLRIRRVEYRIAELPIFLIPVLMTADDTSVFSTVVFWEAGCVFFFLFAFGDLLNCLADRELDATYKPQLTEAVLGIGVRGVIAQAALSAIAAIGLTTHLAWELERWILMPGVVFGLVLAWAYSVEPMRLKGRGVWQLVFYWFGLFTGPMIFIALVFDPLPALPVWIVSIAFGLLQSGVILVNTAEDYSEDREMAVNTIIVSLGLKRGIRLAAWLTSIGAAVAVSALIGLYRAHATPAVQWIWLLPFSAACIFACLCVVRLHRVVARGDHAAAVEAVRTSAKLVPVWMTSTAIGCLIAVAAVFLR